MCISPPKMERPPRPITPEDAATAANKKLQERSGMKGYASTILGGALQPMPNATPQKTLLGG